MPSNAYKNLVITPEPHPGSALFHGEIFEAEAFLGRSSGKELALKFSKLTIYAKYDLCHGCFLRDFNKTFKTIVKEQSHFRAVFTLEETDALLKALIRSALSLAIYNNCKFKTF